MHIYLVDWQGNFQRKKIKLLAKVELWDILVYLIFKFSDFFQILYFIIDFIFYLKFYSFINYHRCKVSYFSAFGQDKFLLKFKL